MPLEQKCPCSAAKTEFEAKAKESDLFPAPRKGRRGTCPDYEGETTRPWTHPRRPAASQLYPAQDRPVRTRPTSGLRAQRVKLEEIPWAPQICVDMSPAYRKGLREAHARCQRDLATDPMWREALSLTRAWCSGSVSGGRWNPVGKVSAAGSARR